MLIPEWLVLKCGPKLAKAIAYAVVALVIVGLLVGLYFSVKTYFTADLTQRVKTISAQAEATQQSAHDAVETTSNVADNAQAVDVITRENANVIDHAKGTTDVVDPAARAAGLHALCGRKSYRDAHPACLQHAHP